MQRQEFINAITTWEDLVDFCEDHCIDTCDDIFDQDRMNDAIESALTRWSEEFHWFDLRDILDEIPYCEYSIRGTNECEWISVDNNPELFESRKANTIAVLDECGWWDDVDDNEGEDEDFDIEPEEISLTELFISCSNELKENLKPSQSNEEDIAKRLHEELTDYLSQMRSNIGFVY